MAAASPGRVHVTVPRADGTAVTVTLAYDLATGEFAARSLSLTGTGGATVTVQHAASGACTEFPVAERGHVHADQLAQADIHHTGHLHGFTVTAA